MPVHQFFCTFHSYDEICLKLKRNHINRRHLLSLYYLRWMSWMISFVWASPSCEVRKATKNHTIVVPDLKRVITLTECRSVHNQNPCRGHISTLISFWRKFYTIVVHSPRVCLDFGKVISPRWTSQCTFSQIPCMDQDSILVAKFVCRSQLFHGKYRVPRSTVDNDQWVRQTFVHEVKVTVHK